MLCTVCGISKKMFLTQNFYGPGIECALARITAYFTNNMKVKDFIRSQGTLLSAPPPSSKKKNSVFTLFIITKAVLIFHCGNLKKRF